MSTNKRSKWRVAGVAVLAGGLVGLAHPALFAGGPGSVAVPVVHVVAPGETLWGLAEHYGPQMDPREYIYDLQVANNIDSEPIYPGEKLTLP